MTTTAKTTAPAPADYKNLVDLLAVVSEANRRLSEIQLALDADFAERVDEVRRDYAELQGTLTESEAAIEALVARHPEWFTDKRSVKTPYGTVKVTRTTKLDVPNEEVTVLLIERDASAEERERFLRTQKVLSIEALETLSDEDLARFRIKRVAGESVKITPAKIDLGKAVKARAEAEAEAAA